MIGCGQYPHNSLPLKRSQVTGLSLSRTFTSQENRPVTSIYIYFQKKKKKTSIYIYCSKLKLVIKYKK